MINNLRLPDILINPMQITFRRKSCKGLAFEGLVNWQGYSGRNYPLSKERLEDFVLLEQNIYIIVAKELTCWVGTANDLVNNELSRSRFREAIKIADCVFCFKDNSDEMSRMNIAWDIEGGFLSKNPYKSTYSGAKTAALKLLA